MKSVLRIKKKKLKLAIFNSAFDFHSPSSLLFCCFFNIDYEEYNNGAKYLGYLLTPATMCLAVPLYEQLEILKKNVKAHHGGHYLRCNYEYEFHFSAVCDF